MADAADFTQEQLPDGTGVVRFSGRLAIAAIGDLDTRLQSLAGPIQKIDLANIDHIDTVGAWLIYRTAKQHDAEIVGEIMMQNG